MKRLIYILLLTGIVFSCSEESEDVPANEITESSSQKADDMLLNNLYEEIVSLSEQYDCSNSDIWTYTPIGAKACGGPAGYIAYPSIIDSNEFMLKVNFYTAQQDTYNTKWGVVSDCSVPPPPTGVECVDGKAVLVY